LWRIGKGVRRIGVGFDWAFFGAMAWRFMRVVPWDGHLSWVSEAFRASYLHSVTYIIEESL
jgi:hypothetical protein